MTLRALISDDEPLARVLVREFLAAHPNVEVVAEADNGLEAARCIQDLAPDLVFLDIQMPKLTGLEVLQNDRSAARGNLHHRLRPARARGI